MTSPLPFQTGISLAPKTTIGIGGPARFFLEATDDAMVDHFRAMADETGVPIIIYNVVPWTYLSPALLCRIFEEVPGVIGVKQSAGDLKLLADLLLDAPDIATFQQELKALL